MLLQLLLLLLLLQDLGRTIVCSAVLPSPGLELTTTPLALANQQLSLLGRTCFTRPSQDSVAASLNIVWVLISSLDKDLQQTGRIHPDCHCPPIAVLQPPATGADKFTIKELHFFIPGVGAWAKNFLFIIYQIGPLTTTRSADFGIRLFIYFLCGFRPF